MITAVVAIRSELVNMLYLVQYQMILDESTEQSFGSSANVVMKVMRVVRVAGCVV